VFVAACSQDTDGDGTSDFDEGELTDSDGDGSPDHAESSIVDTDLDGVVDQNDPENENACSPTAFVAVCTQDTDGDGISDFDEGELTDSDGDGNLDYAESSITDTDLDGVVDESDPENENACVPTAFVAVCTQDTDGDGTSDFDEGELTDSDGDGILDYAESSLTDTDLDGFADQDDPANSNPCVPNSTSCASVPTTRVPVQILIVLSLAVIGLSSYRSRNHASS
jgi:hypothetical protein